ncbi:LolA family protein [Rhodohalobacter mucosus]|uniref:Outer membrane lipoprotein carrier protein LolA n=1 Tax=Rhodohalobacter mucosus TaxID=2079485 RepID=A0A316U3C9_9BACT|nr:outer membrane lipoprotein carrier protein LolA [Rhodohalobacter mucosus]PWN07926.1 outer membrane lipoprotein carrier protein LolA [Rhodohalobacter mucosus]
MRYLKSSACKIIRIFSITAIVICTAFTPAEAQNDTPVFDSLKNAFQEGQIFTALFTHEYNDSFTGEQQYSEGEIWIGRDRYKIEGSNQQMLVDGDISTVYDGTKNRVIISEYIEEEDDFAPSRMLQGADSTFSVTEETIPGRGTRVYLQSEDIFSVFREVLIFIDESGSPVRIEAIDQADNRLITRFEEGEFTDLREDMFQLEVPLDAEVIDLRAES